MNSLRRASLLAFTVLPGCAGAPPAPPVAEPTTSTPPTGPTPGPTDPPAPQAPTMTALRATLPNGMAALALPLPANAPFCDLQLAFLVGTDQGKPGVAELALEAVLENTDAASGRTGLRDTAEKLGGRVLTEVGPASTWLTLRVPRDRWRDGLNALHQALAAQPPPRPQLELIRERMLTRQARAIWMDPGTAAVPGFLLGFGGPAAHLEELLDRDPSDVGLFMARSFRPDRTVLAVRVDALPHEVAAAVAGSIGTWQAVPLPIGRDAEAKARSMTEGLWWAAAPGMPCRVTLLLPMPDPTAFDAGGMLLAHALLTLDGIGGRLEKVQQQQGLGDIRWRARTVRNAELAALALTADVLPERVRPLWDAVLAARQSLRDLPPTTSELTLARQRVPLIARLATGDAHAALRAELVWSLRSTTAAAAAATLERDVAAPTFDVGAAIEAWLRRPAALIAIGGEPPAGASAQPFALLPAALAARFTGTATTRPAQDSAPWLDGACEAMGGKAELQRLTGYRGTCTRRAPSAPAIEETLQWSAAGTLERSRQLLGATVTTSIQPTVWIERSGNSEAKLSPAEAGWRLRQAERHPIALLAAFATDRLRFRPIAQRRVDDRDLMVLEATSDRFDRLRVWIDTDSLLVRIVESWETEPDGAIVHLEERWSDYRTVGSLRVPFQCVTTTNEGQTRHEAVWSQFTPQFTPPVAGK
ncbi:MAG: insulinase family protein [Planctomycetes bacterium]|nr:insulinase family protein [Planctomycetota bacterium]